MRFRTLCAASFALLSCSLFVQAKTYDYSPPNRGGNNYTQAAFRCWVPNTEDSLRGALVVLAGQNADGRVYTNDKALRDRCEKWKFALIGCHFTGDANHYYSEARRGSGLALQNALRDFSDQTGKRELSNAPMALMGFSTGAQFAFSMTCFKSNDVIAFTADKGVFYTSRPDAGTFDTPALFLTGENDKETKSFENTFKMFKRGKERRALWAMHTEKKQAHKPAVNTVREVILDFIDGAIMLRMDPARPFAKPKKVRPDAGYYLNRKTGVVDPRSNRKAEDSSDWSWVPDQKVGLKIENSFLLTPVKE